MLTSSNNSHNPIYKQVIEAFANRLKSQKPLVVYNIVRYCVALNSLRANDVVR
jgi:hypothetical protein